MNNPYDGSVWLNYIPSGVSGIPVPVILLSSESASGCVSKIPKSMWLSGWRPRDHSNLRKIFWQVEKHYPNGRYDEISLEYHPHSHRGKKEGIHIFQKRMIASEEMPTKEQFYGKIAPELAKKMNGLVKKTKRSRKES